MLRKYVAPSVTLKSFNCPRCGALADQKWYVVLCEAVDENRTPVLTTPEWFESFRKERRTDIPAEVIHVWERQASGDVFIEAIDMRYCNNAISNLHISLCFSCKQLSIWKYGSIIFPYLRYEIEPSEDINPDICLDFEEARAILDLSPRGAAALLRLCIQKLCKQLGKPGNNLNDDIAALVRDGLGVDVQRALDAVRVIGNEAVHPGELDLKDDRETAAKLFELVNYIAEDRISRPKKIAALYASLPPGKIAAIEKRNSK